MNLFHRMEFALPVAIRTSLTKKCRVGKRVSGRSVAVMTGQAGCSDWLHWLPELKGGRGG